MSPQTVSTPSGLDQEPPYIVVDAVIHVDLEWTVGEIVDHPEYVYIAYTETIPLDMFMLARPARIPILMAEYVKTGPEVTNGLEGHRNHLLMIMASAIAYGVFLKIDL